MIVSGVTSTGYEFEVDDKIKYQWPFVRAIADADSDDASKKIAGSVKLVELVVGKDENRLMEHIAKLNDGDIPTKAVNEEITEILNAINSKKSEHSPE